MSENPPESVPITEPAKAEESTSKLAESDKKQPHAKQGFRRPAKRNLVTGTTKEPDSKQPKKYSLFDILLNEAPSTFVTSPGSTDMSIDVQPDYRNIFISISHSIEQLYLNLQSNCESYISPCSLMAYSLALFYGHALICDVEGLRRNPSLYGEQFLNSTQGRKLVKLLLTLYVPDFLEPFFHGLAPTSDPRRHNLRYVHTLGCYLFFQDFGRALPIRAFIVGHDLMSRFTGFQDFESFFNDYLDTP